MNVNELRIEKEKMDSHVCREKSAILIRIVNEHNKNFSLFTLLHEKNNVGN